MQKCVLVIVFFAVACNAQDNKLLCGVYDDGTLEINHYAQTVTGYFKLAEGAGCELVFTGAVLEGANNCDITIINTADCSESKGKLDWSGSKITLKSDLVLFPCQRTVDLYSGEIFTLTNVAPKGNIFFSVIGAQKSFLYSKPGHQAKKRPYLVKGDVIVVYEKMDGWVRISCIKNRDLHFWIKESDELLK